MRTTPLVPVEGALALPRLAPLGGVPSFGGDWTFRNASAARPGQPCLATLSTSCIAVDAPHRACDWRPLDAPPPVPAPARGPAPRPGLGSIAARAPDVSALDAGLLPASPARHARDRRAIYAACWSIGALGLIGWLVMSHGPQPLPTRPAQAASDGPAVQAAAIQPYMPARHAATTPVAAGSSAQTHAVAHRPAPPRPAVSAPRRIAAVPPSSPPHVERATSAQARSPAPTIPSRLARRAPAARDAAAAPNRRRSGTPPRVAATRDPLDDPRMLIALANALRAEQAAATSTPPAGFDWTAQLSHRRLTDTRDTFAH